MKFLKPEYVELLKMNGIVVDGSLSSTAVLLNEKLDFIFRTSLSGQYNSLRATLPYSTSLQFLIKGSPVQFDEESSADSSQARVEVVMNTTLKFPKFSVAVDAHLVGVNGEEQPSLVEVYLNGHKIEIEEAQRILGTNNPAINLNPKVLSKFKIK